MSNYTNLFKRIADTKPAVNYPPRPAVGVHSLALINVGVRDHDRMGPLIEASFLVTASDDINTYAGEECGWAWFVASAGFTGEYEQARCRDFLMATSSAVGMNFELLVDEGKFEEELHMLVGANLTCEVTEKAVRARTPEGTPRMYKQATWRPDVDQNPEILMRVAIAAEARALSYSETQPERAGLWMEVFGMLRSRV